MFFTNLVKTIKPHMLLKKWDLLIVNNFKLLRIIFIKDFVFIFNLQYRELKIVSNTNRNKYNII